MTLIPKRERSKGTCKFWALHPPSWASQVDLMVKNLPDNAWDIRDIGSIPGSGRSPGGGHGNPLQYSCLESPMDRGAWRFTIHGTAKSWTRLKWLSMHLPSWTYCLPGVHYFASVWNECNCVIGEHSLALPFLVTIKTMAYFLAHMKYLLWLHCASALSP